MSTEHQIGIVAAVRDEENEAIQRGYLHTVLDSIPHKYIPRMYLSVKNASGHFIEMVSKLTKDDRRIKYVNSQTNHPGDLAFAYLKGLEGAMNDGNSKIIEIDVNGAHDPKFIPVFLESLDNHSAAFSTRFGKGGAIERYPIQRRLISKTGTLLANLVLDLGKYVPDMTSGYEAFRNDVLVSMFSKYNIDEWISVSQGPGHFYQTEMRTKIIWAKYDFEMIPIIWGRGRFVEPYPLPIRYVARALISLIKLKGLKNQTTL